MRIGVGIFLLGAAIVDFVMGQPSGGLAWIALILGGWFAVTGFMELSESGRRR